MIKLEVHEYCHRCFDFKPSTQKPSMFYGGDNGSGQTDTIIRCESRSRCEHIREHIREHLEKDKEDM